ncbi:MAG: ATP-dependent RNA helicase HrpA, partial [Ancrocorticia sp.]|uniref:ATP-dependent RNA helicase HrpA n=1 Tax=Ancrocorticia sp. TaxID=2593684 RepID=UPI003F91AE7E
MSDQIAHSHAPRGKNTKPRNSSRNLSDHQKPAANGHKKDKGTSRHPQKPVITYPEQLPVSARREEIASAIRDHQVVIVAGETGSGKTTQLPKICMDLGRGVEAMIGHTQPRRIAARSVAERICHELSVPLGGTVGYQVRFTEEVGPDTMVKLMTDGILLAEIQSDPDLLRYDTLIIDEAHERSLNIDFILGYLARLLPRRPDLKVIVTSATIDTERFAAHFGEHIAGGKPGTSAPIVEVSGRTYPVEIRYEPLDGDDDTSESDGRDGPTHSRKPKTPGRSGAIDQATGIVDACQELMAAGPGDILVFLSGEGEIRDTQQALADELGRRYVEPGARSSVPQAVEVLPLFARLSSAEQHRIFESHPLRRIILATNIAETSLTVPGIRYVVDPGTARISRYSNKTKVQRLPIEAVSQASANQRAGRSGRVADGICIRLYSQEDFEHREEFTQPEIQRTSLASVILQMISLGLGDISKFPFIDPPEERAVRAGMQLLEEIGAVDTRHGTRLTKIGHQLSRLPLDPRLGRMLIEAQRNGCASEVLILVAALSVQDVRERPTEKRAQADQLHARFTASSSDFLAYLTLWRYLHTQQRELSGSQFRRTCRAEYLNYLRYREWSDVVSQLQQMARPLGLDIHRLELPSHAQIRDAGAGQAGSAAVATACRELGRGSDTPEAGSIHRSMLVGLLSNLGNWSERTKDYAGARGTHFVIWPGSGLHR